MKRFAVLLVGVSTLMWATGCCCLWPNYCSSYYGGCPDGNCGYGGSQNYQPGGYQPGGYQPGAQLNSFSAPQSASLGAAPVTASPIRYNAGYPQAAMAAPLESLPTY